MHTKLQGKLSTPATAMSAPQWRTRLVSGLVFPAQELLKRHSSVRLKKELEHSQWLSRQQIQQLQLERLRKLLVHAGKQVPYYRTLFERLGFRPEAIRSVKDLRALPFLDKPTIRAHIDQLVSETGNTLYRFNTGGSSGEPLIFYVGRERRSHDVAAKWRATRWWDVDIGDPEIVLWGSPIELGTQDRIKSLRDAMMRTRLLSAFSLSDSTVRQLLEDIRAYKPRMLFGYPSALSHIARFAETHGIRMDDCGIKVAFVTSERLYQEQRDQISKTFGCPVANGYGGRDAGFIAHECPHGGMHITAEDIVVEIVDADGSPVPDGVAGEIVVTHLATGDFPFIRYRTGDVAVLDTAVCSCGRGLPLLKEIQGRTTDFIVASDGTVMHGLALIYVLREIPQVRSFKIIQESLERTTVMVVPDPAFDEACTQKIIAGFKSRLGEQVGIDVQLVEAIPAERSGKFRYVVSKVNHAGASRSVAAAATETVTAAA
jgi:phenylacetate-CoA ligase